MHGGFYGTPETGGLQAELARIPLADGSLVAVRDIDPDTADERLLASLLTLSDVYLTGYHAAHMGQVARGKIVTVVGDGAVGLSAVLASRQLGAERIILMERHAERTDLGVEWGATDVVAARGEDGVAEVMDLMNGEGSHVVLEAVGLMPAYEQLFGVVRPGGIISRVGVPQYEEAPVGFASLFGKNARLAGGPAPVRAYMDDTAAGYAAMDSRAALKVMLTPRAGAGRSESDAAPNDHETAMSDTTTEIMVRDAQTEVAGPAEHFTGRVTIRGLFARAEPSRLTGAIVTFEPGARSAWHTHPLGQTLIVTEGVGWTQVEDWPVQESAAGDIVLCPRDRRHWHGATPDLSMTHVAVQEALDGTNVVWMEPVSDEQYLAGRADRVRRA